MQIPILKSKKELDSGNYGPIVIYADFGEEVFIVYRQNTLLSYDEAGRVDMKTILHWTPRHLIDTSNIKPL